MTTLTWVLIAIVAGGAGLGGGYVVGKRQAPADSSADTAQAIADQTLAISSLGEAINRPAVLSEEIKASLAGDVPAGCREAAASLTPICIAMACQRTQQSEAGRCDSAMVADLVADYRLDRWATLCADDLDCIERRASLANRVK